MKKRFGFVSNSSSSSFIMGYGRIANSLQLQEYMKKHQLSFRYDFDILKYQNFEFDIEDIFLPKDIDNLIVVNITNNEGDGFFNNYEECDDFNYEKAKNIDFYNKEQQAIIKLFDQPFMESCFITYGAQRID